MIVADIQLTRRQREVLSRFVEGRSVTSIATELRCSEWTIRAHLAAIAEQIESPYTPMRKLLVYGPGLLSEGS